jgi:hypothetical protein
MNALPNARRIARLVLAWFALSLGVAVAAPLVKPERIELVCSAGGALKLLAQGDAGSSQPLGHTLHCPLCAGPGAPPPLAQLDTPFAALPAPAVQPRPAARTPALAAAPLPARGPPAHVAS